MLPRELGGLFAVAIALAILLALVSFSPADVAEGADKINNLIGPVGARVGDWLFTIFGLGAFCFDALLWYLGFIMLVGRRLEWRPSESFGQAIFVLSATMIAHLALGHYTFFGHQAGGFIGELGAELMRGFFGTVGAYIIAISLTVTGLMLVTNISLTTLARSIAAAFHKAYAYIRHRGRVHLEYRQRLREERLKLVHAQVAEDGDPAMLAAELAMKPIAKDSYGFEEGFEQEVNSKLSSRLGRLFGRKQLEADEKPGSKKEKPAKKSKAKSKKEDPKEKEEAAATKSAKADPEEQVDTQPRVHNQKGPEPREEEKWSMGEGVAVEDNEPRIDDASGNTVQVSDSDVIDISAEGSEPSPLGDEAGDFGPRIVESEAKERARRIKQLLSEDDEKGVLFKPLVRGGFELPKISFLNYEDGDEDSVDIEQLREMAAQIEKTLRDFKVEGQIKDICPGPVITVFEFSPAPGVKISKIANLSDDLAMALAALSVRIVAPIPGKGVVGIEVPNPKREIVYMKEIIADKVFYENEKMALPMGLGKDTAGSPIVTDLAKMPHLLVAGATGSGKSVAVNTMITSLLYKNSPDDVRLIMVDPKMLEFSIYADIPHLLLPVVTDPKQATVALNWVVQEMEKRYQKLADLNVRNIKGYNKKVAKLTEQAQEDSEKGLDDSKAIRSLGLNEKGEPEHTHIPYIVVIIDEFADLMMTASKDVETAVARLAQKARAAGIHLILATQRPSTDVITGLIKANFPTRIALRVTSKTDSRVILDSNGAENLLGNGDMLFVPPGTSYVQRVHGAYVSEVEIEQIVDFLKSQGEPQYNEAILAAEDDEDGDNPLADMDRDEHYEDAVRLVVESGQASISMIQRKLRVGYNRAARMVEMMEAEGLVSPPDGCKPREVLVDTSPY
jgi:S-DNA-T family DNA segregation ATPase FtsK/SpoIIIE